MTTFTQTPEGLGHNGGYTLETACIGFTPGDKAVVEKRPAVHGKTSRKVPIQPQTSTKDLACMLT